MQASKKIFWGSWKVLDFFVSKRVGTLATVSLLGGTAENVSDVGFCDRCYGSAVCPSFCLLVLLAKAIRCHLAGALMWPQVTLYQTTATVLSEKGRLERRSPSHCKLSTN